MYIFIPDHNSFRELWCVPHGKNNWLARIYWLKFRSANLIISSIGKTRFLVAR